MFIKDHVYLNKTLNSLWSKRLFTQSDVYFTSTSNTSNLSCLDRSIDGWIDEWIGPYPNDKLTFGSKAAQNKDWKENIKWITWNVFIFSFHRYYRFYRYEITTNVSLLTRYSVCSHLFRRTSLQVHWGWLQLQTVDSFVGINLQILCGPFWANTFCIYWLIRHNVGIKWKHRESIGAGGCEPKDCGCGKRRGDGVQCLRPEEYNIQTDKKINKIYRNIHPSIMVKYNV